jgi:hypothetical protein
MNDLNWKTWGFVFIIALGTTFEVIKRLPSSKAWDSENLRAPKVKHYAARGRAAGMNRQAPAMLPPPAMIRPAQPVQQTPTPPPMTKEQLQALMAAHAGKPGETEFGGKDDKAKKEDEWEIVLDPKTGKMVKRKKKKKVAKKEKKEEKKEEPKKEVEKKIAEEDDENHSDSEQDIDTAISAGLQTGKLAPLPKNKADEPFASAEEWIKRLLNRPNLAETNRFIDHYRKNLVTSEVFYKVVNAMLADSRAEMKKLGIHAVAQVPSAMSFQILVGAAGNSRNDASVKAKADEALNSYTAINRVGVLKSVLKGGAQPAVAIKAAQLVKTSAEQNLSAQSQGTTPPNTNQTRNRTTYEGFRTLLDTLSRTATDAGVKAAAGETLARLNDLLTGSPSQTAVAQQ